MSEGETFNLTDDMAIDWPDVDGDILFEDDQDGTIRRRVYINFDKLFEWMKMVDEKRKEVKRDFDNVFERIKKERKK